MLILFTVFIFLFLIILATTTQNMIFFGLALLILGALFFYLKVMGMATDPNAILIAGVYCVVWGIMTVVASITNSSVEPWIFTDGLGGIFLLCGIYQGIINVIVCREKVSAIYMGAKSYITDKGRTYYSPFFSYIYQGRQYKNSLVETFGKRKLKKKFQEWDSYTIYLNPRNPNVICLKRYPQGSAICIMCIGIICILIPFFSY